jgi:A1 cistron-splicing factor AAR2
MPVTGTHPVGTLQVHDEDSPPPPLEDVSTADSSTRTSLTTAQPSTLGAASEIDDILVVLDMPENYIIGYDAVSLTAKSFKGISDIPPGPHFFWWTSPNGVGARSGLWIVSSPEVQRVHVMQWSR